MIEPSLELADLLAPSRAELADSRRAQRYFAQSEQTLFIDINGDAVTDRPYSRSCLSPIGVTARARTPTSTWEVVLTSLRSSSIPPRSRQFAGLCVMARVDFIRTAGCPERY